MILIPGSALKAKDETQSAQNDNNHAPDLN